MLYRKAPPQPSRMLLRVVAVAGASALLGATACSSSSGGSMNNPEAGPDGMACGAEGVCGSVPEPDGGPMGAVDSGPVGIGVDGGIEVAVDGGCHPCGVGPIPDDAGDGGPPPGVAVMPDSGNDG